MQKTAFLGIDIGTSALKVTLLDGMGAKLGYQHIDYGIIRQQPGWAEQDPQTWIAAASQAIRAVLQRSATRPNEVAAIGLSGQMHTLVCLDKQNEPVCPAILWADRRSGAIAKELMEKYGKAAWGAWTGNPLAAGFSLTSWMWLQENDPAVCQRTAVLVSVKDFVRLWLTGDLASDPSDASATGFFDPYRGVYAPEVLEIAGISTEKLPQLKGSLETVGGLSKHAAAETGLLTGTPVITGGGDQAMQAFAQGIVNEGQLSCTIGSGGQLFAPISTPRHDPELRVHLFCHILPATWHLQAATLSAGLSLRWFRETWEESRDYPAMLDAAARVAAAKEGLFFLPYLNGERTPWMDAEARGAWIGLRSDHNSAHLTRAILEGVVFSLRQGLDILNELGMQSDAVVASGGATYHPLWLQLQADIFNLPVIVRDLRDASAWGAAMAAAYGSGYLKDLAVLAQVRQEATADRVFLPGAESTKCQQGYQAFKELYPKLYG